MRFRRKPRVNTKVAKEKDEDTEILSFEKPTSLPFFVTSCFAFVPSVLTPWLLHHVHDHVHIAMAGPAEVITDGDKLSHLVGCDLYFADLARLDIGVDF